VTRAPQNGRPAQELNERFDAIRDATPVRTSCLLCDWTYAGTAIQGREQAAKHRLDAHPSLRPPRRRRNNIRRFNPASDEWKAEGIQRAAEVAKMITRREKRAVA
jgi:hypothetical protein